MCVCVCVSAMYILCTWQQKLNIAPAAELHSRIMLPIANVGSFPHHSPCLSLCFYAPVSLLSPPLFCFPPSTIMHLELNSSDMHIWDYHDLLQTYVNLLKYCTYW